MILRVFYPVLFLLDAMKSWLMLQTSDGYLCFALALLSGTARGCGWQKIGAYVNLGSYYLIGIPSAIVLAFVLHVGGRVKLFGLNTFPTP